MLTTTASVSQEGEEDALEQEDEPSGSGMHALRQCGKSPMLTRVRRLCSVQMRSLESKLGDWLTFAPPTRRCALN